MLAKTLWLLTRRTAQSYSSHGCSQLAAAISYYVLFSIVPLAIFLVSIFGLVVRDEDIREDVATEIVEFLDVEAGVPRLVARAGPVQAAYGPGAVGELEGAIAALSDEAKQVVADRLEAGEEAAIGGRLYGPNLVAVRSDNVVTDTVRGVSQVSGAFTIIGLAGVAWSASAMFGAIRKSLNIAWDAEVSRPIVQQKLVDLAMVAGLGVLLGASLGGTAALRTFRELSNDALGPLSTGTGFVWAVLPLFLPAVFTLTVFLIIYRYVPNAPASVSTVWPGALLATVLFELLKNSFALYVAKFDSYAGAYGALGGLLLFMLWTYLAANILLIGAEFAAEYGRLERGVEAPPRAGAAEQRTLTENVRRFVRGLFVHPPRA